MVGETLGLWRLVRGLGRGGMGEVYEAEYDYLHLLSLRYAQDNRTAIRKELEVLPRAEQARLASEFLGTPLPAEVRFAIKVCNARSNTSGHRRFLQEAEVAQRLGDHPYIVSVHAVNGGEQAGPKKLQLDQGRYRDVAFMVMDLAVCSFDGTRLTVGEAVHIVRCIATALDHAHAKGVVHRDLKPENILGSVEHPLLTDFGIAKEVDQSEGLTRTGQIIGTLDYMSPEQATDAKRVDQRSDVYSLGVVLYEFATQGHLPYEHKADRDSALAAIRSERAEPKWPREQRRDFPPHLERIVLKCMAYRQEDRYQSMSDLVADLDRFTRGERIPFLGHVTFKGWSRFQLRRHPRMVWSGVAMAVLTVVIIVSLWLPRLLDTARRDLDQRLTGVEKAMEGVRAGKRQQLSREDEAQLARLHEALADGRYGELSTRVQAIEGLLRQFRRLDTRFSQRDRTPTVLAPDKALDELRIATRAENPGWHLDRSRDGLVVADPQELTFTGPYGSGLVYCRVRLQLPTTESLSAFRLQVDEAVDDPRHQALWTVTNGQLTLTVQEDERAPVIVRQEPITGTLINFAFELSSAGVRTWINGPNPQRRPGLTALADDAPASLRLTVPAGTVIEAFGIWPRGPQ